MAPAALRSGGEAAHESHRQMSGSAEARTAHAQVDIRSEAACSSSPVQRLYAHALQSICTFADLKGLSQLMAVSRNWQSAVLHMRPICGSLLMRRHAASVTLHAAYAAPLHRHWGSIDTSCQRLSVAELNELAERMPHVRFLSLDVSFTEQPAGAPAHPPLLRFPAQLQTLRLRCIKALNQDFKASSCNCACICFSCLIHLRLHLLQLSGLHHFRSLLLVRRKRISPPCAHAGWSARTACATDSATPAPWRGAAAAYPHLTAQHGCRSDTPPSAALREPAARSRTPA